MRTSLKAGLVALAATGMLASAVPAQASVDDEFESKRPYTFAVIGDVPYGSAQLGQFPTMISQINADPDVRLVTHVGDIKSGSTVCSDEYFRQIRTDFDLFADPLVYTVGDNEWTDCHRANNGGYDPLERLAAIRKVFFTAPGRTLGQRPMRVESNVRAGVPEDVRYERAGVQFAGLHVVGSNNSLALWTGRTAITPEQQAEVDARTADVLSTIRKTFREAREERSRAVVLQLQADMFDPTVPASALDIKDWYGFTPIVQEIAKQSVAFGKPVYLFNGDSHVFTEDKPLAAGSSWVSFYGAVAAPNLTRITVDGSNNSTKDWVKVTIDRKNPAVLSWTRVPYTGL